MKFLVSKLHVVKAIYHNEGLPIKECSVICDEIIKFFENGYPDKSTFGQFRNGLPLIIDRLKDDKIIDFDKPLEDEYDYQAEHELATKKYNEAWAWKQTLSEKEQEMVNTLMRSMIATAG